MDNFMEKVLVLMSTYNGEYYVEKQIDSIIQQKGVQIYLLIRDDGSKDETYNILLSYQNKYDNIYVIKGVNVGCANSFKELLIWANRYYSKYRYFAFADQDDIWFPDKLISGVKILSEMPKDGLNLYCSNLIVVDNEFNIKGELHPKESIPMLSNSLIQSVATGCTMIFTIEVVSFFNKYQPQNMRLHDLWIYHTCMIFGNVYYDPNSYIYYRQHGGNVIGAKITRYARIKSKMNSLTCFWKQHNRENEAKELLAVYGDIISSKSKDILNIVAYYRSNIKYKYDLIFSRKYNFNMNNKVDNFWFKIRVVLNCI